MVNLTIRRTPTECESLLTAIPSDRFSGCGNVVETNFVGFMRAVF